MLWRVTRWTASQQRRCGQTVAARPPCPVSPNHLWGTPPARRAPQASIALPSHLAFSPDTDTHASSRRGAGGVHPPTPALPHVDGELPQAETAGTHDTHGRVPSTQGTLLSTQTTPVSAVRAPRPHGRHPQRRGRQMPRTVTLQQVKPTGPVGAWPFPRRAENRKSRRVPSPEKV